MMRNVPHNDEMFFIFHTSHSNDSRDALGEVRLEQLGLVSLDLSVLDWHVVEVCVELDRLVGRCAVLVLLRCVIEMYSCHRLTERRNDQSYVLSINNNIDALNTRVQKTDKKEHYADNDNNININIEFSLIHFTSVPAR